MEPTQDVLNSFYSWQHKGKSYMQVTSQTLSLKKLPRCSPCGLLVYLSQVTRDGQVGVPQPQTHLYVGSSVKGQREQAYHMLPHP